MPTGHIRQGGQESRSRGFRFRAGAEVPLFKRRLGGRAGRRRAWAPGWALVAPGAGRGGNLGSRGQ